MFFVARALNRMLHAVTAYSEPLHHSHRFVPAMLGHLFKLDQKPACLLH